jgi:glycosyltransferase involved in cell wall biosynthesis
MTSSVSVIMAAFNAEPFIEAAVRSVLGQTYPIRELIVVNDGSTDGTLERLKAIAVTDSRLRVLSQANQGFSAARNAALREATGEWIAVADADDVQLPHRLAVQMTALEQDPMVTVCGAGIEIWDGGAGAGSPRTLAPFDDSIRALMPFESPLFDPTVVYRASLLPADRVVYDRTFRMAADYDLWSRLAPKARFRNLPDIVTRYRQHPQQVTGTARKSGLSLQERSRVWTRVLGDLLSIEPSERDLVFHEAISAWPPELAEQRLVGISGWFRRLMEANRQHGRLDGHVWTDGLSYRWFWVHRHSVPLRLSHVFRYFSSPLAWNRSVGLRSKVGLIARACRASSQLPASKFQPMS